MDVNEIEAVALARMEEIRPFYDEYLALHRMLRRISLAPPRVSGGEIGSLVVNLIKAAPEREMTTRSIQSKLGEEGHDLTLIQISNALTYAANAGSIQRVERGIYRAWP